MKKRIAALAVCAVFLMLFCTGCFGRTKLDERFDKEKTIEEAEKIIDEVHIIGLEKVLNERMREDYLADYPMETSSEDFENLRASVGAFMAYTQETIVGKDSPDEKKEPFAVVAVTATYEEGELLFMLTFDTDMKLVSFYVKK